MTVLVARPEEDARGTIDQLAARGIAAIAAPVLEIQPVSDAPIPPAPRALLVTSTNAIRALSARPDFARLRTVPVLTVGERTAEEARRAGFADVVSAGGDVADLLALVRRTFDPETMDNRPFVYVSGRDVAGDLDGDLGTRGYKVERVVVYRAEPASDLPHEAKQALAAGTVDAVLFYSARGCEAFAQVMARTGLSPRLPEIPVVVMSSRIAQTADTLGFRHISVAETPQELALLDALEQIFTGRPVD